MKKLWLIIFGSLAVLFTLLVVCIFTLPDGKLHIFVLDVGQGDSILIQLPTGERILVDGGPDDSVVGRMQQVMPFYERNIDVIILTHPHVDHVNGLNDVLKRYHVMQVMITGVNYGYAGYTQFLDLISRNGVEVIFAGGVDYKIGNVVLDMLFPLESLQGRSFENHNNSSIVFRLLYGARADTGEGVAASARAGEQAVTAGVQTGANAGVLPKSAPLKFYFSGDLELEGEQKLIAAFGPLMHGLVNASAGDSAPNNNHANAIFMQGLDLSADFYKVGHHGSRTSSSEPLLNLIHPTFAAISCGVDNKFKHPYPETIKHLQSRGVKIFRTDLDGTIEVVSDGKSIEVRQ